MPWTRRNLSAQVLALRELRELRREFRPDIVHLHSSFAGVVGAVALRDAVTVYTPNAYSFTMSGRGSLRQWAYLQAERFIARRVTLTGAASGSEAELARERVGARRVEVVCNGIPELDPGAVRSTNKPPGPPRVIAIGRTVRQRRPVEAARILSAVSDVAEVEWVGGGYPRSLGFRALQDHDVPMSGWVPREDVMSRLREATAYLHWTEWDGLPFSVLESLAMDAVVVASDIPPNREVLGEPQVRSDESEAIELLRRVLSDQSFREQLLARQRELRGFYGAKRMVDEWIALYQRIKSGLA
jgi:glycosyltransferase involved in cell wall biosynthesis